MLTVTCWTAEVLISRVYVAFAAAFVTCSRGSVALWLLLQPIRDVHDVWKFPAMLQRVSDLSHRLCLSHPVFYAPCGPGSVVD